MFRKKINEKDQIQKVFSKYVTNVDSLLSDDIENQLSKREIAFVLISIDENDMQLKNISQIVNFLEQNDVMVEKIEPVFIKGCIGALHFDDKKNKNDEIERIIGALKNSNIDYKSCLYGVRYCQVGNIGSSKRMSFSVLIPEYSDKLVTLFSLSNKEIKSV